MGGHMTRLPVYLSTCALVLLLHNLGTNDRYYVMGHVYRPERKCVRTIQQSKNLRSASMGWLLQFTFHVREHQTQ